MKKYGKKYAPWLLFLFVAACLLTSTAAALPDSGAAASVPQAELEQALEEAIFRRRDGTPADVSQYNLTEEQLAPVTAGVLADNYADALVTVSYDSAGANSVSAMDVEMDSTLSMALDELDPDQRKQPGADGRPGAADSLRPLRRTAGLLRIGTGVLWPALPLLHLQGH